jgi:hypothetical protein
LNLKFDNITFFDNRSFDKSFTDQFDVWTSTGTMWSWFPREQPLELKSFKSKLEMTDGVNIAFVYAPNSLSKNYHSRRINEQYFKDLAKLHETNLHSMQYGIKVPYATNYDIKDFVDTLQIIESVDKIHTVDTSVAHLLANSQARHSKESLLVYRSYIDWRWTNNLYDLKIKKV